MAAFDRLIEVMGDSFPRFRRWSSGVFALPCCHLRADAMGIVDHFGLGWRRRSFVRRSCRAIKRRVAGRCWAWIFAGSAPQRFPGDRGRELDRLLASVLDAWRVDYTTAGRHSRLGWMSTPVRPRSAVRCASMHRRPGSADRRHHRPNR
jgi:hypothetical protein